MPHLRIGKNHQCGRMRIRVEWTEANPVLTSPMKPDRRILLDQFNEVDPCFDVINNRHVFPSETFKDAYNLLIFTRNFRHVSANMLKIFEPLTTVATDKK